MLNLTFINLHKPDKYQLIHMKVSELYSIIKNDFTTFALNSPKGVNATFAPGINPKNQAHSAIYREQYDAKCIFSCGIFLLRIATIALKNTIKFQLYTTRYLGLKLFPFQIIAYFCTVQEN